MLCLVASSLVLGTFGQNKWGACVTVRASSSGGSHGTAVTGEDQHCIQCKFLFWLIIYLRRGKVIISKLGFFYLHFHFSCSNSKLHSPCFVVCNFSLYILVVSAISPDFIQHTKWRIWALWSICYIAIFYLAPKMANMGSMIYMLYRRILFEAKKNFLFEAKENS